MPRPALVAGAGASLALTLYFGRHNPHMSITVLFAGWVTAPYVILGLVDRFFQQQARVLHAGRVLGWLIGVGTNLTYAVAIVRPRAVTPAAPFVAAPLVALILLAFAIPFAVQRSRRSPAP